MSAKIDYCEYVYCGFLQEFVQTSPKLRINKRALVFQGALKVKLIANNKAISDYPRGSYHKFLNQEPRGETKVIVLTNALRVDLPEF